MTAYAMMLWEPISTPSSPFCPSSPAVTVISSSSCSRALYQHAFALLTRIKFFFRSDQLPNEEEEHCTMMLWKSVFVFGSRVTLSPSCRALDHVWHCHHRASRHWITCVITTIGIKTMAMMIIVISCCHGTFLYSFRSPLLRIQSFLSSLEYVWIKLCMFRLLPGIPPVQFLSLRIAQTRFSRIIIHHKVMCCSSASTFSSKTKYETKLSDSDLSVWCLKKVSSVNISRYGSGCVITHGHQQE